MSVLLKRTGNSPAVKIEKPVYTMATVNGNDADITMYGDIYENQPTDWYGNPVDGQYILLSEFLDDLDQLAGCSAITIHMNSYGGDAGASNMIHNKLRELARNGTALTCIVDGVAMSGGSIIMCACDTVKVNPSSIVMIHKCISFLIGAFNSNQLRAQATSQDAWDKMQVEIYKRKTGLSDTVISHMMAETTYMTGREAVEKGFADELIEDTDSPTIAASADRHSLFVNGRQMHLAPGISAPDNIPTVTPEAAALVAANKKQPVVTGEKNEGGISMTMEELREKYPELVSQVEENARASVDTTSAVNSAVAAEAARLQEIDGVASLFDDALVQEAKYGKNRCDARELAYRAAQAAAKNGHAFLSNLNSDAAASGVNIVPAAPGSNPTGDPDTPEAKMAAAKSNIHALLHKKEV